MFVVVTVFMFAMSGGAELLEDDSTLFIIALLLLGVGLTAWSGLLYRRKRMIENLPTSKIRSMAVGLVEIEGRPIAVPGLLTPFSGVSSAYCRYTIEKYVRAGRSSYWKTLKTGSIGKTFHIKDGTGKVKVDPQGANFSFPHTYRKESGQGKKPSSRTIQFLEQKNISHGYKLWFLFNWNLLHRMRFTEFSISPNLIYHIVGNAGIDENASPQSAESSGLIVRKKNQMYITQGSEAFILRDLRYSIRNWLIGGVASLGFAIILYVL